MSHGPVLTAWAALLLGGVSVAPGMAQESTWNGLPNRFRLNVGGFRVDATTVLRAEKSDPGIDFETTLKLPQIRETVWIDATLQVGRRHQLSFTYTQVQRESPEVSLDGQIDFGDELFPVGAKVRGQVNTKLVSGYYRFALMHSERFQIGPTVGLGYLTAEAGIRGTTTVAGVSRPLEEFRERSVPTGAVGGYMEGWLARRLVLRGNFLYIKANVKENDLSLVDGRVGLDAYPFRHLGLGAQYKYDRYSFDSSVDLGGKLTYQGIQYYLSFQF